MRKGAVEIGIIFPYVLIMAIIIIFSFAIIPSVSLDDSIQVSSFEASVLRSRFLNKFSYVDPLTFRVYPASCASADLVKTDLKDYFVFSREDYSFYLNVGLQESYFDEDLFLSASRSFPSGDYVLFDLKKIFVCNDNSALYVEFSQALPEVYDV